MKRLIIAAFACTILASTFSCSRDSMSELNTDPDLVTTPTPEWLLSPVINGIIKDDRRDVYEQYEQYGRWMQYVSTIGNTSSIYYSSAWKLGDKGTSPSTNYKKMFKEGRDLEIILESIKTMPSQEQDKRQYLAAIAKVLKVYLGWKASDVCGDIPYTEANRVRFGGTMTPKYDSQIELYKLFDAVLKEQSAILSSNLNNQISVADGDFLLGYIQNADGGATVVGNANTWASRWAKFANTLRLKIALRYQRRDAANFTAVLNDVVDKGIISSGSEEAVYISNNQFTEANEDDINRIQTNHVAGKSFVDFMLATKDPRLNVLLVPNMYAPEDLQTSLKYSSFGWTLGSLKDSLEKLYALGVILKATKPNQYYVGYTSNPNLRESDNPLYKKNYTLGYVEYTMGKKTVKVDTISRLETSVWFKGGLDAATTNWRCIVPVISYADVCFMCAEITEKGLGSVGGKTAKQWYEDGIKASMEFYQKTATNSGMIKLEQRTAGLKSTSVINEYISNSIVSYVGTSDEKLEKIALQAWMHFYRQPEEAWSYWRRTGLPKFGVSSIFSLERCLDVNKIELFIPRRAALAKPTATGLGDNTLNWKAAIANMEKISNGEYFNGVGNVDNHEVPSGRVWWDKK